MNSRRNRVLLLALVLALLVVAGCSRKRNDESSRQGVWTPAPVTGSMQLATPGPIIQATSIPFDTSTSAAATPVPAATSTRDPNVVVITEQDVLKMMNAGVTEQEGATMEGGGVDFKDGKMVLTAQRMSYGFLTVDNLQLVGKMVARDGKLQMETESITPRGVVTSLIPTLANQALAKYTSKWYVEDVQTYDDRIELRIRP